MPTSRLRIRAVSAFWLLLLLVVALARSTFTASAATRILTDSDKGAKISIVYGDQIELRLASNPSTGYMWYVHPKSTSLVKLISQSETDSKLPGVGRPGVQIFHFVAREKGDGVILLHYVRSWDPPDPNEKQFDLHVSIK